MSRTLILVRHGDAEPMGSAPTDAERSLTERGMRALEEAFPRTFGLVLPNDKSELWVSSALRARQTAEIANRTLNIKTVRESEALFRQDDEGFLDDYAASDAELIVAIGHVPFVEDMAAQLCGQYLHFSTGSACAIDMGNAGVRGRLIWYVQGPMA